MSFTLDLSALDENKVISELKKMGHVEFEKDSETRGVVRDMELGGLLFSFEYDPATKQATIDPKDLPAGLTEADVKARLESELVYIHENTL